MPPANTQPQDYDFIVNPPPPPKHSLLEGASTLKRVAVVGVVVVVLLVLFSVVKGVLSGGSEIDLYVRLAQDQQQLIALANDASKQQGLSTVSVNSAVTASAGLSSDQASTLSYLKNNGKKLKPKELNLTASPSQKAQLQASIEAGTYDSTYKSVMKQQLEAYARHLQQVYKQTNGKKGHELINNNYRSATLLLQQLETP